MREGGTGRGPKGPTWGGSSGDRGWEVRLAEEMARKSPWGLREQMEKALRLGQSKTRGWAKVPERVMRCGSRTVRGDGPAAPQERW